MPSRSTGLPGRDPKQRPTHIHGQGANHTRCGIKMNDKRRFPYVGAAHVQAHIDGYGMVVCPVCLGPNND